VLLEVFILRLGEDFLQIKQKLRKIYLLQKKNIYSFLHDVMKEDFHRAVEELLPECERVLPGVQGPGHQAGTALLCVNAILMRVKRAEITATGNFNRIVFNVNCKICYITWLADTAVRAIGDGNFFCQKLRGIFHF
jgi:hypothetical protein